MFFSAFGVPGTILNVLHVLTHLAHIKILLGYIYSYGLNCVLPKWLCRSPKPLISQLRPFWR